MNRREFILAALGAATLDPERALWIPGKKLISIPAVTPGIDYAGLNFFTLKYILPRTTGAIFADTPFFKRLVAARNEVHGGIEIREKLS